MITEFPNPSSDSVVQITPALDPNIRHLKLDALRGIAVLLVIGYHTAYRFEPTANDLIGQWLRNVGWLGVDIFFVLSGYLIVKILMRDSQKGDLSGFFVRRFFRIVPIYLIAVGVHALGLMLLGKTDSSFDQLWMTALFLNGWVIPFFGLEQIPFTITWSLSVEIFVYLILGLAAALSNQTLRRIVIVFFVTAILVRWVVIWRGYFAADLLYVFVPARLDSIAAGGLAAMGWFTVDEKRKYVSMLAGLLVLGLLIGYQWTPVVGLFLPLIGYSIFALTVGIWVSAIVLHADDEPVYDLHKALASIGRVSYFMYLFHLHVLEALLVFQEWFLGFKLNYWLGLVVVSACVYWLGLLSWKYIEAPLISYGSRLLGKWKKAPNLVV